MYLECSTWAWLLKRVKKKKDKGMPGCNIYTTLNTLTTHNTYVTIHMSDQSTKTERNTMTPGVVVRIRINPTTCMSVLDTLEAVGIDVREKTFATCVSAALNILVETAKKSGVLPEPDPYEYSERMKYHQGEEAPDRRALPKKQVGHLNPLIFPETTPDLGTPKWAKQGKAPKPVAYTPTADDLAVAAQVKAQLGVEDAPVASAPVDAKGVNLELSDDPMVVIERKEAGKRVMDAVRKKERANGTTIIWSDKDEENFLRDYAIAYPNG